MGIFDIFKKKPQKNKYQIYYESISDVLKLLERKRRFVENRDSILDLEFDKLMFERVRLADIIKSGSISFLGGPENEIINNILEIFSDRLIRKDDIQHVWDYLINEQNKLKKLF
jgi:hypothetical protein